MADQISLLPTPKDAPASKNLFCKRSNFTNEATVEKWFLDPLIAYLGFGADDQRLKTSIGELKIGKGSKSSLYKPDYIIEAGGFPVLIIDAKSPNEDIDDWVWQCRSYCLELNQMYEHNPVEFYLISNGLETALYKWDKGKALLELEFGDFVVPNEKFAELKSLISKSAIRALAEDKRQELQNSSFDLEPVSLETVSAIFHKLHDYMREKEKKTPSAAFMELMKIVFVKIKKDRELREAIGNVTPKVKDVVFSVAWIESQTESESPINDPLFKNLRETMEVEIHAKHKHRIFDPNEEIQLSPSTILKVVRDLEHIDFYHMDEDIHGRMFESFLDATVRGPELGQFFTPRDVVKLMVELADVKVSKNKIECVLDACCGSGGFLISAMSEMLAKAKKIVGLSSKERRELEATIRNDSLVGIDAGSDPKIYRIARMNMYLHGDGGANIFFADALDKKVGLVGKSDIETDAQLRVLRKMLLTDQKKFDVILSNPPFSLKYSRDSREQHEILNQYKLGGYDKSLLSSVMFLERYNDLVAKGGRILTVIDDSILSGESYSQVRDFIRANFIIVGIVSLPGDAFRRADARVKTSVLILRSREAGEEQGDIFMDKCVYLGLTPKTAKRVGISRKELESEKPKEMTQIAARFNSFMEGHPGSYVVKAARIMGRLDVKHCLGEVGRRRNLWKSKGITVAPLEDKLEEATGREVIVEEANEYILLKVTYDGEVLEAERKFGDECSYRTLYKVESWDILSSNMGIGRGAIGIVPDYLAGSFVSNEYTILRTKTPEDAIYFSGILRTKEILGDILASTTGMNRGRLRWAEMRQIVVPLRDTSDKTVTDAVDALKAQWAAHSNVAASLVGYISKLAKNLKLDGEDSRLRWLAYKPPE
ncbi:MAG TPA: N-6 DNA methylase [Candidatus Angelobacter sp.]|nr:N-6 DNA methylase [Candidatus Angelobacter sp.]